MKKSLLIVFLLFLSLSSAHATLIGIDAFLGSETVIDFNDIDSGEPITDQFVADGVNFFGDPFVGDPFPDTTINGTMSGANNTSLSDINNPIVAEFNSVQNRVGMYFGTPQNTNTEVQIQAFLEDSPVGDAETFESLAGNTLPGGNLPTVFGGIFLAGGFDKIEFRSISNNRSFQVDDFRFEGSVNPIPEPATILLLGAGLVGIAGFGRKKFFKK